MCIAFRVEKPELFNNKNHDIKKWDCFFKIFFAVGTIFAVTVTTIINIFVYCKTPED
jgi:hypothetical protein